MTCKCIHMILNKENDLKQRMQTVNIITALKHTYITQIILQVIKG